MIAGAIPPPVHMVTNPVVRSLLSSSSRMVPIRIDPVAAIGCPRAIAPPFTFTFRGSNSRSLRNLAATTEKASLISKRSISL